MRNSMRKGDPGYPPKIYPARILVDGVVVRKVITADTDLGFVEAFAVDEQTGLVVRALDHSGALTFVIHGKVQILPI